ncbi:MarR family transcriptional regulator [Paenibacillus sp. FSL R7-0273]|nr:MarR family transcriptional regulator [Paenibacillus sp. FSL R7-0273]
MLANRIQALGDKLDAQMTTKQWLLIAVILKSGSAAPTLSDLAAMTGSSRQNVKKMALLLEKQGLVELAKDAQDARIVRVRLTEACMVYLAGRSGKEEKFMAELFNGFDGELTGGLFRGLAGLSRNIIRMEAGSPAVEKE